MKLCSTLPTYLITCLTLLTYYFMWDDCKAECQMKVESGCCQLESVVVQITLVEVVL